MDLRKLCDTHETLLTRMKEDGYSEDYIKSVRFEINWIKRNPHLSQYSSYLELYEERIKTGRNAIPSLEKIYHKRSLFTLLQRFDENNEFPDRHKKVPIIKKSAYSKLNIYYKAIVDEYKEHATQNNSSKNTITKCVSKASCFFLFLQNQGHISLQTVTEGDVLSFFTDASGNLCKSRSYKRDIESVLAADNHVLEDTKRIRMFLPAIKNRRKNIQYFTRKEAECIRNTLENNTSDLSKRDIAIGMLLYFTGMRAGDISDLCFDDINWDSEIIHRSQNKTSSLVEIPLSVNVGNALYDYIMEERAENPDPHIFLWCKPPFHPIDVSVIWPVTAHIYNAANIRQNPGDRRGSHLFRHHVATHLASKGFSQPIISEILGHDAPESINNYLSSDIEHLRTCALSIKGFPVAEGVFQI